MDKKKLTQHIPQDRVKAVKEICHSMITASHYNQLDDKAFRGYIQEICQLFKVKLPECPISYDDGQSDDHDRIERYGYLQAIQQVKELNDMEVE